MFHKETPLGSVRQALLNAPVVTSMASLPDDGLPCQFGRESEE